MRRFLPAAGAAGRRRSMRPGPVPNSSHMRPPKCSTIWRLIGKPEAGALRPGQRVAALAELLEDQRLLVGGHAGAVVADLDDEAVAVAAQARPRPGRRSRGTNLAALDSRFSITCISRSGSARSGGTASGRSSATAAPRSRNSSAVVVHRVAASARAGRRRSMCHSAWPDSILAMSSTWLTRRLSRSLSATMMPRNCCALPGVHVRVVEHQLGERADRGQRRAQLVGHRGHEVVLQVVEALQLLVGGAQLGGRALERARLLLERARVAAQLRRLVEDLASRRRRASGSSCDDRGDHDARRGAADRRRRAASRRDLHQAGVGDEVGDRRRRASRACSSNSARARAGAEEAARRACSRSSSRARPRQNTGLRRRAARAKTSTNSSAWLASRADGLRARATAPT